MDSKELIKKFLTDGKIKFIERDDTFFLESLNITIPADGMAKLPKMQYSIIAMEVGMNNLHDLMIELEKLEKGAQIYDFKKETAD